MLSLVRVVVNLMIALLRVVPLVTHLMGDRRVPFILKLLVPAALIYVVSPIDLIPDIIGGIGWLDDLIAIATALLIFLLFSPKPAIEGYRRRWGFAKPQEKPPEESKITIEGYYEVLDDEGNRPDR